MSDPSSPTTPITNRRGTFSKAKSFRRGALNLGEVQSSPGTHPFRFISGEEYSAPNNIENIKKPNCINVDSEEYKTPVFLGANGTLYNKYYIAIKIIGIDEQTPTPITTPTPASTTNSKPLKKNNSINDLKPYLKFNSTNEIYKSFPEPTEFDDYIDYEYALLEWKKQIQENIGVIQLPHSVGRTYSRPKVIQSQLFRKNSEASNDDSFSYDMERKLTDSDLSMTMKDMSSINEDNDSASFSLSPKDQGDSNSGVAPIPTTPSGVQLHPNASVNLRERSNSDTSTGSFEGTQLDGSSPLDGSPSTGSLAGFIANGTRSRSNSSTYNFDQRNQRSNSLSPKHALQGRLIDSTGSTIDQYGKMGRSGSGFGINEESWYLQKDPWDAQLILTEPMPELFSSFEEYEYSMKNWTNEVISKTSILPPHPSQFIQLPNSKNDLTNSSGITDENDQSADNNNKNNSLRQMMGLDFELNKLTWTLRPIIRPIITEETMIFNRILSQSKLRQCKYQHLFDIDQDLPSSQIWKNLPLDEKDKITDVIDRWYRKKLVIHRQSSALYRGGHWSNQFLMPTIQSGWRESLSKKGNLLPPLSLKAIRRHDINSEADGKRVELSYPVPELPINFGKLLPPDMNLQYFLGMFELPTAVSTVGGSGQPGSGNLSGSGGLNSSTSGISPTGSVGGSSKDKDISSGKDKENSGSTQTASYIAMHSISNTSNVGTKDDRRSYVKILQTYEQRLQFSFRLDTLNSWCDNKLTAMELQEKKSEIEQTVAQPGFDLQNGVWALVNNSSHHLDKFQETFDQSDFRLYSPTIPLLPAIVPSMVIIGAGNTGLNSGSGGGGGSSSGGASGGSGSNNSSPTNMVRPGQPLSPHITHNSPPNRQGSTGSFSFTGSPHVGGGSKISPSGGSSGSIGNSLDSPRTNSQLAATVERGSSPRNNSFGGSNSNNTPSASSNTFLSLITTDSFPELLKFLDLTNETLAISKISTLALLTLASELKGTMVIESILFSKDTLSLYRLAKAISFFDAVPLDLFPYPTHLNEMLTPSIYKGSTQEVVRLVFVYYYLGIIQERLNFHSNNVGVLGFINNSKKDSAERIGIQFQNDKDFLLKMFRALGRKSTAVSNCFLFVLIQLIKMSESPTVQSLLKVGLLDNIRDLSCSKYSHSRFAAKRLFQILSEDPWKEFLMASYTETIKKTESQHLIDLTSFKEDNSSSSSGDSGSGNSKANSKNINSPPISLITELTFNFCTQILENINGVPISKPIYKFILNDFIFNQLLNNIVKSKTITQNTEIISKLFVTLCKVLSKYNLLKTNESIKSGGKPDPKKQNDMDTGVSVSPTLLFEILTFLQNSSLDNFKYGSIVKTNMLIAFRQLLKVSEVFDYIKKELNLYTKFLIPACRDGKNSEFNRNAWRLVFQMIRYHPGHIEYLEKMKYLTSLLDIISLNAGNVVLTNAIHYLTKLFSLVSYESRKNALRSPGQTAIDIKYSEKDVKSLVSFFVERHVFIKFHMIYKKLTESNNVLVDQRLLKNITTFYRVISFLPSCQKLLKDTLKNPEYKVGIIQVSKMYKPNETF